MTARAQPAPPAPCAPAQAMILAAGRGERMRPLTDSCPKPLLQVRGKALIQYHIDALGRAGFDRIVVNTAWLGAQLERHLTQPDGADANPAQPRVLFSREGRDFGGALETAGGVARALPLLGDVFWLIAGDVHAPAFVYAREALSQFAASGQLARLFLVPNPVHHPDGDFALGADGLARNGADGPRYTYSGLGLYRKALFDGLPGGNPAGIKAPLAPLLRAAIDRRQVGAELYEGAWTDVGSPERLAALNRADPPLGTGDVSE